MANKLLDDFQKLDISFQYCEFILNNTQSNNTRVLALNIYESFICRISQSDKLKKIYYKNIKKLFK